MSKLIDLTGQRFGRLVVVRKSDNVIKRKNGTRVLWECLCDCGNTTIVCGDALKSGNTKSCGCLHDDTLREISTTHGFTSGKKERLYDIWAQMKMRCNNQNNKAYKNYGGRGITVCDEWEHSYSSFREWAYNNGYDEHASRCKCTLDRIDNNGNYCPENCRFVDYGIQMNNRRSNHTLTYNNETHTMTEWSEITGLDFRVIQSRIKRGWTIERTLTTPKMENN